jgi:hypothetical protein
MILTLQITALFFALIMVYFAVLNFRRKELNSKEVLSWIIIWIGVMFVVIFPDAARAFSRSFLFARLFDLMVLGGVALAILISAKSYLISRKSEKKLERYVRKEAVENSKLKDKNAK